MTSPKRNILMVCNYPSDTGYAWWLMEHFWCLLAEHFRHRGGTAFLAYPRITTLSPRIKSSIIEAVELTIPWVTAEQRNETLSFIKQNGITDIYFTDQAWFNPDYLTLRLNGVKNIVVHDHTPGDRPPIVGLRGWLKSVRNRFPGVCADWLLAVSPLMRERHLKNARVPAHRCLVVQNGIEPVNCPPDSRSFRQKLGIADDHTLIVTTGRAHPYKRFDFIINTAAELWRQKPDAKAVFLLVGDGPALPDLTRQVEVLGLRDRVRLLGFRKDTRDILCASDIAIHAALGEGFSLSIIEYMSSGLPVLVPDIPSVRQAIDNGETGLVFRRDSSAHAAKLLLTLLEDPALMKLIGQKAHETASSRYTLEHCNQHFAAACQQAF